MRPRKVTAEVAQTEKHAAIYIRVSTGKQVKSGLGLEDQKSKTLAEAERLGVNVAPEYIFVDEGISGKKSGNKRPNFDRLMQLVAEHKISHVIVNDLSRLGRSVSLISKAIDTITQEKVIFVSVKERFDTSTAMGVAMLGLVAVFAQLESDMASERTEDALDVRGEKYGYKSGHIVYGYTRTAHTDDKKSDEVIRVNEEQAKIVRYIFKSVKRTTKSAIARRLNEDGVSTNQGGKWYASTINCILDNEHIYKGTVSHYPAII